MAFFGLLKKKKKFDDFTITQNNKQTMEMTPPITTNAPLGPDPIAQMLAAIPENSDKKGSAPINTYDIIVLEPQEDGTKKQSHVTGVKATSAKSLMQLYAAEGAEIRILKEYKDPNQPEQKKQQLPPQQNPVLPAQPHMDYAINQEEAFAQKFVSQHKEQPKYFEIGGVKCKLENGKMFQEQWVKVDSTKYRLVSDSSNKILPMTNKHLEMLKWVQIEDNEGETKNA